MKKLTNLSECFIIDEQGIMTKLSKILSIIAAALLFITLLHLPYGYYTFMRIAVTGIAGYLIYIESQKGNKLWLVFYIASAIVFNPIIPIYLRHKHSWMPIDIAFGLIFIASAFFNKY